MPRNRAAAAARAMFPQSRHPVRRGRVGRGQARRLGRRFSCTAGTAAIRRTTPQHRQRCKSGEVRCPPPLRVGSDMKLSTPHPHFSGLFLSSTGRTGASREAGAYCLSHILHLLPRWIGRPPFFVSCLAYLHVCAAPFPELPEVASATLGMASVWELFFSCPRGHYRPRGGGVGDDGSLSRSSEAAG